MTARAENHWQNRVRFARRKLVDAGIIDPSEHGRWQLVLRPHPAVWIEKSLVKGRPDRTDGPDALGRALWTPLRAQNGADIYRNMRLVRGQFRSPARQIPSGVVGILLGNRQHQFGGTTTGIMSIPECVLTRLARNAEIAEADVGPQQA
jgi:hypothetical protein